MKVLGLWSLFCLLCKLAPSPSADGSALVVQSHSLVTQSATVICLVPLQSFAVIIVCQGTKLPMRVADVALMMVALT